jgi:hypothetical protein
MMSLSSLTYADQSAESNEPKVLKVLYAYMEACNARHFKAVIALSRKSDQLLREVRSINSIGVIKLTNPTYVKSSILCFCIINSN